MQKLNRFLAFGTACALGFTAVDAVAGGVWVLNSEDAGPGSFRDAVAAANGDPSVTWIKFTPGVAITLTSDVEYTGAQTLSIDGQGAILMGASDVVGLFIASGGASLDINKLEVTGSSGYGIVVRVPEDAMEDIDVVLSDVTLTGNGLSALLIDDSLESPAGISLTAQRCQLTDNGGAASDVDAIRINETGAGGIAATIKECVFEDNANDAIELDESDAGDVSVQVMHSSFYRNGLIYPEDLEDGIDIDETGEGDVVVSIVDCEFDGNGDQATDFNERGPGDLYISMVQVVAFGNQNHALRAREYDEGDLRAVLNQVTATSNLGDGVKIAEANDGDVWVELNNAYLKENADDGVQVEEKNAGSLLVRVVNSIAEHNGSENDASGSGVDVSQGDGGEGLLRLEHVLLLGNVESPYKIDKTTVIEVGVPQKP